MERQMFSLERVVEGDQGLRVVRDHFYDKATERGTVRVHVETGTETLVEPRVDARAQAQAQLGEGGRV